MAEARLHTPQTTPPSPTPAPTPSPSRDRLRRLPTLRPSEVTGQTASCNETPGPDHQDGRGPPEVAAPPGWSPPHGQGEFPKAPAKGCASAAAIAEVTEEGREAHFEMPVAKGPGECRRSAIVRHIPRPPSISLAHRPESSVRATLLTKGKRKTIYVQRRVVRSRARPITQERASSGSLHPAGPATTSKPDTDRGLDFSEGPRCAPGSTFWLEARPRGWQPSPRTLATGGLTSRWDSLIQPNHDPVEDAELPGGRLRRGRICRSSPSPGPCCR